MKGLIARKIGMTQVYDQEGCLIPVTVLEAGPCVVNQVKTVEKDGYSALQLAFEKHKKEFRAEKIEGVEKGQELKADIFAPGDSVVISGTSIGKGTAGTVKRWHFSRGPMGHGSKNHRLPGSIGAGTTPGRVFKGLKMSGRMGNKTITQKNIKIVQVDVEKNFILVKGAVPGSENGIVSIIKNG